MLDLKKTGTKMIACIYYDLLRHVNSKVTRSLPMKLNTIYRSQDVGVPNDDRIWLKKITNEILQKQQKLSSRQPLLIEVYTQQVQNNSSLSIDSSNTSNIDLCIQVDLLNLAEFDDTQLNKIVIPLG